MIYLFIYLTLLKAASGLHWIEGFLQDYSGMYQEALQKAQDYLKPPENTIDYHYILAAQVVAHTLSLNIIKSYLSPFNVTVTAFKPGRTPLLFPVPAKKRKFTTQTLESTLGQKSTFYPKIII